MSIYSIVLRWATWKWPRPFATSRPQKTSFQVNTPSEIVLSSIQLTASHKLVILFHSSHLSVQSIIANQHDLDPSSSIFLRARRLNQCRFFVFWWNTYPIPYRYAHMLSYAHPSHGPQCSRMTCVVPTMVQSASTRLQNQSFIKAKLSLIFLKPPLQSSD